MQKAQKAKVFTDVVILKSNSIVYDTRVKKIASSLNKKYSICVCGWNREKASKSAIKHYPFKIKLFNLKAPIGKLSIVKYYPFFWIWILIQLIRLHPKVVHACDLDTVPPAFFYKFLFKGKLVFDVFDRYAMAYLVRDSRFYSIVQTLEEYFALRTDVLITVSTRLLQTFGKKTDNSFIIMNCPTDAFVKKKSRNNTFKLVYTGNIVKNRGIELILSAIENLNNIELELAGRVIDKELLTSIAKVHNARYKGILSLDEALNLEASADALIVLYDPEVPIHNFATPNKIFIGMMFGIPTITNLMSDVITEERCGILVDYHDVPQIRNALKKLRDDYEYRNILGENGRIAYMQKYNWRVMESRLFSIYDRFV